MSPADSTSGVSMCHTGDMVRTRSTFDIVSRLALAYAVAFQALFGALAVPAFAGVVDSSLILCRTGGEGPSGLPAGDGHMPADHCLVMCQIGAGPGAHLAPGQTVPNVAPGDSRGEALAPAIVAMPDGSRHRAPNARGPPRLG